MAQKENTSSGISNKVVRWLWYAWLAAVALVCLIFLILSFNLPSFEELENPNINLASIVYAEDGRVLGKYYIENRESIDYKELNPYLVQALVSTEDSRFYKHNGIDFIALGRVIGKSVLLGRREQGGGSTISQQLAKLLFDRPDLDGGKISRVFTMVGVKFKEWLTATRLERSYTKEEIIAMYLNQFDFINGAHGIQAASQIYFGKNQDKLTVEESALLIGMLKNPSLYNPNRFVDNATSRRNVVLNRMESADHLSEAQCDSLKTLEVDMSNFKRDMHSDGPAPYFRMELTKWLKDLFNDEKYRKPDGSKYNIYKDGLKIYTTINLDMQKHAEAAMKEHLADVQKRFFRHWGDLDPWTYGADKRQKEIRKESLNNRIRESERYEQTWQSIMGQLAEAVTERYDIASFRDKDIINMVNEESKQGTLRKMVASKLLSQSRADAYEKIMKSDRWEEIKKKWNTFEVKIKKDFNTKREMRVFAYNDEGEKTVEMTPLDSIKYHRKILQCGSLGVEPQTGKVKFWVGGADHKYFKFDHIESRRQVGSTFKPFVYSSAIALQGLSPCQEYIDKQYTIPANDPNFGLPEPWSPANADGKFYNQPYNLYHGLLYSKNSISIRLMMELGSVEPVIGLINNMGIDSSLKYPNGGYVVPRVPSICLGSADLTVMEMTGAYTVFANNGVYSKPIFVVHVEDKNGKTIYQSHEEHQIALNPHYNYVMVDMLRNNTATGFGFGGVTCEYGGKTGTTNDYTDCWFLGITPNLVVGTWVGGEDPWIRFMDLANGQGSINAKPFFGKMLKRIQEDPNLEEWDDFARFLEPPGELEIELDCDKYKQKKSEFELEAEQRKLDQQDELFEDELDLELDEELLDEEI